MPTFPAAQASRIWPSSQTGRVAPASQSGRTFPARFAGSTAYAGTKAGQLDGVDERLRCAVPVGVPDTNFSVSLWLKVVSSIGSAVYATGYAAGSNYWRFSQNGATTVNFRWQVTGDGLNANMTGATVGVWMHYVAVCTGTAGARQITYYRNGGSAVYGYGAGTPVANTGNVYVGCSGLVGSFSNIEICDLATWNKALSGAEVASLYNSGTRLDPRTVAGGPTQLWAFTATDDMTGTTGSVADLIGGNPLIPTNTESGDLVAGP